MGVGGSSAKSQLVQILDESGDVWRVREATSTEFGLPVVGESDANLAVFDDQNDVLVRWVGPACQSPTSLLTSESGNEIRVWDSQQDGCDAAGATYGVVLSYDTNRQPTEMSIQYPQRRPSG